LLISCIIKIAKTFLLFFVPHIQIYWLLLFMLLRFCWVLFRVLMLRGQTWRPGFREYTLNNEGSSLLGSQSFTSLWLLFDRNVSLILLWWAWMLFFYFLFFLSFGFILCFFLIELLQFGFSFPNWGYWLLFDGFGLYHFNWRLFF
jgi:hypothetical protein